MEDEEKVIGMREFLAFIAWVAVIASAITGVYSLIWGGWLTLRVCLTVIVTVGMIAAAWSIIEDRRRK